MYLVTLYFDEKTNRILQRYIDKIAEKTGNYYMTEHRVPPHMTISQIEANDEGILISKMKGMQKTPGTGKVDFVSVGMFLPYVLYVSSVYNRELHAIAEQVYQMFEKVPGTKIDHRYQPMSIVPHVTVGKKLTKDQMLTAVKVMQEHFVPFQGNVVEIGLSKVNPYEDLVRYRLEKTGDFEL